MNVSSRWLRCGLAVALAAVVLMIAVAGCSTGNPPHSHTSGEEDSLALKSFDGDYPIQAVCTTGPVADMLRNIGGDALQVTALMGPGVDPHLYRAVPTDLEKLTQADLIVYNGLHLEGRMADTFERLAKSQPVLAVTQGLVDAQDGRLRRAPEFDDYYDPHVWHDAALWADCGRYVLKKLQEFDPTNSDQYMQNADRYFRDLRNVDAYCRRQIATIPENRRVLVTAHDAFGYFSKAYGMETHALKGISTDDEVSIGRMDETVDLLIQRNIPAVFVESAVAPRNVEALIEQCQTLDHRVVVGGELYADAMGPKGSGAGTYTGMIKANVDTIVTALNGQNGTDDE